MINRMTNGVKTLLKSFSTANYSTATDGLADIAIYRDPEFDPTDKEKYSRLLASGNVMAVIWGVELVNDESNSPTGYVRVLYSCKLTIVSKSANQWDATASSDGRLNRIAEGSITGNLLKNSIPVYLMNFMAYLHQNKLNDGSGEVSFIQNLINMESPVILGDFISYTATIEAKHMFSSTISVTPV